MEQPDILRLVIDVLERIGMPYMVVGSIASMTYGEPRLTQDIDVVGPADPAQLKQLCDAFPPDEVPPEGEADGARSEAAMTETRS